MTVPFLINEPPQQPKIKFTWKIAFVVLVLLAAIGRRYFGGAPGKLFAIAALALFLVKILLGLRDGAHRLEAARQESRRGFDLWKEFFPPWFRGLAKTEWKIYREVCSRTFGLESPSAAESRKVVNGMGFTLSSGNISTLLVPLAVIGLLADLPLSQLAIQIWHPPHVVLIHVLTLLMAAWGFVWILGDRLAVRALDHSLDDRQLVLRVGFRWACDVPVTAIKRCAALRGSPVEWQTAMQIDRHSVWRVTPIDPPNVLLEIDPGEKSDVKVMRMGASVELRKFLAVYVDSPTQFIRRINDAIDSKGGDQNA